MFVLFFLFFFNDTATTQIYTSVPPLSLHDALPILTDFKWRHFQGDVILWAVRWYCRYPISYRDLEEMLAERGISVDHTTIYRWVQCYAPEMEKRLRWFWRRGFDPSWRLDETYVKVRGKWTYLYRAVD